MSTVGYRKEGSRPSCFQRFLIYNNRDEKRYLLVERIKEQAELSELLWNTSDKKIFLYWRRGELESWQKTYVT